MNNKNPNNCIIRMNKLSDLEDINPEESLQFHGFYYYPSDRRLIVNKNGVILNPSNGKIIKGNFDEINRRTTISISSSSISVKSYYLHRVIAETFVGRPPRHLDKEFKNLTVNHVDRNRLNNNIDNLEWVTNQENVQHAHLCGLHPKDKPVLAMSLINKDVLHFTSSKSCADHFGIHRATLWKHLESGNSGFFHKNGFIFKYENDPNDWVIIPKLHLKELGASGIFRAVVVKNISDGRITVLKNITEAAIHFKISKTTLWRKLKKYQEYLIDNLSFKFLI